MASPQKENGFTPIANEILERLVNIDLLGAEFRVLLFIIRKTYGYQKKQDRISFTQFEKGTGISRQTINKTIKNLVAKGLIVKICLPGGNIGYSFVKDHENWIVKTHLLVKGKWVTSQDVFTKTSKDVLTHKRKKENKRNIVASDIPFSFENYLKELEDHKARHVNVIGHFFEEKGIFYDSREKANAAVKRHLKPAVQVSKFSDDEIVKATKEAKKQYGEIWTVETILKILTR